MTTDLTKYEQLRKKAFWKVFVAVIVGLGCIVGGMICNIFMTNSADGNLNITFVIISFALYGLGVVSLIVSTKLRGKLIRNLSSTLAKTIIDEEYPDCTFDVDRGIDEATINDSGFFLKPDRYYAKNYLSASYENVPFEVGNYNLQRRETTYSKGGSSTSYETYAKGTFISFKFKQNSNQIVKVVETLMIGMSFKGLQKIDTESIEFNKKFNTYTSDPLTAFYILTPQIQLDLLAIEKMFKGQIFFSFDRDKLYIAINDSKESFHFGLTKKIDSTFVEAIKKEVKLPKTIVDELKLSSDKYNRKRSV